MVDGTVVDGFNPDKFDYVNDYEDTMKWLRRHPTHRHNGQLITRLQCSRPKLAPPPAARIIEITYQNGNDVGYAELACSAVKGIFDISTPGYPVYRILYTSGRERLVYTPHSVLIEKVPE